MKCAICNKKTKWDTSYGNEDYIICPACFKILSNNYTAIDEAFMFIFKVAHIKKQVKKTQNLT